MSERVNFAIVGCGEISLHTSESVLASRRARVVHCMDVRRDLAADLAARHGARFTDRLEDVLADDEVRAVIVPTPHFQHAPLSIRAARVGKHVLVEKPLACTLAEADAMIAAADEAGVRLGVFHPQRLAFGYAEARRLVRAGALGRIVAYKIHAMSHKPPHYWHGGYTGRVPDDWRIHLETSGGGYLIMNLIHNLDSMVSILDPAPQRIYAEYATLSTPVEVEDFVSFVMRLDGGAIVSLDGSSAAVGAESFGDRVYGQRGQVAVNRSCRVFLHEPWEGLPAGQWVELSPPEGAPDARTAYLDAFAEAILTGGEVPVSGREGRRALEIARGAYLSMQRGGPVSFPVSE
jgi:predicted dehydrogenase